MGFAESFRQGREAARAARGGARPPGPPKPAPPGTPSPIKIGYHCDLNGEQIGGPNLFEGERHCVLYGLNGAGKSTHFLIELLMTSVGRSILVFDIKGELAYQTAAERRRFSNVKIINPSGVLDMPSDGYNPLTVLKAKSPELYDAAAAIADALIEIESGSGQYWSESAQGLLVALIMYEVIVAEREHRAPSLYNVRTMLTEADQYAPGDVARRRPIKGLSVTAARMIACGNKTIANLAGRFVREHGRNELASIQSTAMTQTEWMESDAMQKDLVKSRTDLRELRQRPTTIYVCMDAKEITRKRKWTRVVIASALAVHFEPGPMSTLFVLDEFRAALGKLSVINDVWSLVRGYGVQLMPILQSALQLKALFSDEWENYSAQAGVVATLGPPGDLFTAEWMSKRCGVTTILQSAFNLGDGVNTGDGLNAGSGMTGSGITSNRGYGTNYGRNASGGFSVQQVERPLILPNELMDIRPGHGLMWLPGMGTQSIPFFAPNYWKRREILGAMRQTKSIPARIDNMGFMDEFRRGRNEARAARGAPPLEEWNTGGDDDFDAPADDYGQDHPARIAELEAALRERDAEAAEYKQLIAEFKKYAVELQETVVAPLVAALIIPGVKAMLVNRFHRDKNPDASPERLTLYDEAMCVINEAYSVIAKIQASASE